MNAKMVHVLVMVAIIEGVLIVALILTRYRGIVIRSYSIPAINPNPLYWALEYESPDKKFEELVKKNPKWISYHDSVTGFTALSTSAVLERTNCVRILIANGANVEEAVKEAEKWHGVKAIELIRQVQSELRQEQK